MKKKPNVLFIFSDQHNARCLSSAGHPDVKTPVLDKLASEGMRFENAYCQNPICTPSRMSALSSLYPSTHGYYGLYGPEPFRPLYSMFRHFKENGYRTGALGKLHTPRYWIERDCQFVYDEFLEHPKYLEGAGLYEANDNRKFTGIRDGKTSSLPLRHSCESVLAKQTIRFMRNEGEPADRGNSDVPWMAWVCFARPHQPYTPSEQFASMYDPEKIFLPPHADTDNELFKKNRSNNGEAKIKKILSAYLGLVSQLDYGIGMIIEELERTGELDNTIIVYSTDHGDFAGEHSGFEKGGGISTRAITRIPLIFRYPDRVKQNRVCDEMVESIDIFPTLCELSGTEIPNTVQGLSFNTLLQGAAKPVRGDCITENPYRKAIATKQWRYVANFENESDELYNVVDDPWELTNLIDDPAHRDIAAGLCRKLFHRVAQARKPVHTLNGFWHRQKYDRAGLINLNECGEITPYW
jgi:arylsulfatase A-like enzyme